MSEGLQNGQKGQDIEAAVSALEEQIEALDSLINSLNESDPEEDTLTEDQESGISSIAEQIEGI